MSQEKDTKPTTSTYETGGRSTPEKPSDGTKRPYATLDLKATEVAAAASADKIAGTAATGDKSDAAAKPTNTEPKSAWTASAGSNSKPAKPTAATSAESTVAAPSALTAWIPSLISGAAGAVLALLGLGSMGLIGGDPNSATTAERLAALEKSAATAPTATTAKQLAVTEQRLAAMETAARDLAQSHANLSADTKTLDQRLATQSPVASAAAEKLQRLEQQLTDLSAAANADPQRGRIPALAQITTKLGDLDTQIATKSASLKAELSQELEQRLAAASETAETARARLAQRTQSLEQTLKSVADDTSALRTTVDSLKGDLEARFKATAKPADVTSAVEPVATRIAGLEKNLASVVRSEQDRNATAGNILLSIELGNLKRAIDRGGRYASELSAVKKVGGEKLNLAVLESAQTAGVPSLAALTTEFRSLAYKMLDAEADPDQGSVMERLMASAKSVVRVRKVAHNPDDKSTEAVIGRMEDSLKEGRLGDLLDEAKTLGDKPRVVAASWLKKIEARAAIEQALVDLEQSLKNALAGSADIKKGAN